MEITENILIKRLRKFAGSSGAIIRGIGDDGAVVSLRKGKYVFVQDALVENVHFRFDFVDPYDVGQKALYVNISDILAMGAEPLYFLVTIGVPERFSYRDIEMFYKGMAKAAREFRVMLLGGDTVATDMNFFVDVSMTGRIIGRSYFGRDKARAGDLIGVTGCLGESAYGLHLLRKGAAPKGGNRYVRRYRSPRPPYDIWKELVKSGITDAMMDISDGLIIDLERMMAESRTGAEVILEKIPLAPILKKQRLQALGLAGGEDYQFLFTFPRTKASVIEKIQRKGYPVAVIGEVVKRRGVRLFAAGRQIRFSAKGYEHFGTIE